MGGIMGMYARFIIANEFIGDVVALVGEYWSDDRDQWVRVFGDQHISFEWEGREVGRDWWMLEHLADKHGVQAQNSGDDAPRIRDHYVRMTTKELEHAVMVSKMVLTDILDNGDGDDNERRVLDESRVIIERVLQINEVLRAAERLPGMHIYYYAS